VCGISGFIGREPVTEREIGAVSKMDRMLAHRGPDDSGFYHEGRVCLAMRRLSIIDLETGRQPIFSEDRKRVLIFNGEIYNHKELREFLIKKGHVFATQSDSETIIHLYEEYGPGCLEHLRGMFAIVLYDRARQTVFIARDRIGEKPIYLCETGRGFFFASEIKALLKSGVAAGEIDHQALHYYFHYRYIPEPMTPVAGIRKLKQAHHLLIHLAPWKVTETRYWQLTDLPPVVGNPARLLRETLADVANQIVRSDVPVGIALSGGLDSSAIACLLAAQGKPVHAISLGYGKNTGHDERRNAEQLAVHLKLPFIGIEADKDQMVEEFGDIVYWRDDPISDISGYNYYSIMKAAKAHNIKVMIQGQGGDELFLSYDWVLRGVENSILKSSGGGQRRFMDCLSLNSPDSFTPRALKSWTLDLAGLRSSFERYRNLKNEPPDQLELYNLEPMFRHSLRHAHTMYTDLFHGQVALINVNDAYTYPSPWHHVDVLVTASLFNTYLLQNGIAQGERLSMANSVELRLPLVDHKLVALIVGLRKAGIPLGPGKTLLKSALAGIIPEFVLNRPKKGFSPPVRFWQNAIYSKYRDQLFDGFLTGHDIIRNGYIEKQFKYGMPFSDKRRNEFMKLLVLELWFRRMIG